MELNFINNDNNSPPTHDEVVFRIPKPPPKPKFSIPLREGINCENIEINKINTKSITFGNEINAWTPTHSNQSVGEIPLIFSRSSSLISCDVCQSSAISEYSACTSGALSPNDFPVRVIATNS